METNILFVFVSLANAVVFLAVFGFSYKRLKRVPYMLNALVSGLVLGVVYVLASWYRFQTGVPQQFLENFSLIPIDFMFLSLYLYTESLYSAKIPERRLMIVLTLFLFNITLNVLNSLDLFEYKNFFPFFAALTYFYGMIICFFTLYVLIYTNKQFKAKTVKFDIGAVSCLIMSLVIFQISGISQYWYEWANLLFWIGNFLFIGSIGLIVLNSLINGNYIYMIPNPIQSIMVYNQGGILLYNRTFNPDKHTILKTDECMISGAMTGFALFFKEILGKDAAFKYIDAQTYEFYFEHFPKNLGSLVVVTKKANKILLKSMKNLVDNIPPAYLELIRDPNGRVLNEEFDTLLHQYFSYLDFRIVEEAEAGNPTEKKKI